MHNLFLYDKNTKIIGFKVEKLLYFKQQKNEVDSFNYVIFY